MFPTRWFGQYKSIEHHSSRVRAASLFERRFNCAPQSPAVNRISSKKKDRIEKKTHTPRSRKHRSPGGYFNTWGSFGFCFKRWYCKILPAPFPKQSDGIVAARYHVQNAKTKNVVANPSGGCKRRRRLDTLSTSSRHLLGTVVPALGRHVHSMKPWTTAPVTHCELEPLVPPLLASDWSCELWYTSIRSACSKSLRANFLNAPCLLNDIVLVPIQLPHDVCNANICKWTWIHFDSGRINVAACHVELPLIKMKPGNLMK